MMLAAAKEAAPSWWIPAGPDEDEAMAILALVGDYFGEASDAQCHAGVPRRHASANIHLNSARGTRQ